MSKKTGKRQNRKPDVTKEAGYYMLSGYGDAYQVYSDNVSSAWVENGALNIDPHLEEWAIARKQMASARRAAFNSIVASLKARK